MCIGGPEAGRLGRFEGVNADPVSWDWPSRPSRNRRDRWRVPRRGRTNASGQPASGPPGVFAVIVGRRRWAIVVAAASAVVWLRVDHDIGRRGRPPRTSARRQEMRSNESPVRDRPRVGSPGSMERLLVRDLERHVDRGSSPSGRMWSERRAVSRRLNEPSAITASTSFELVRGVRRAPRRSVAQGFHAPSPADPVGDDLVVHEIEIHDGGAELTFLQLRRKRVARWCSYRWRSAP